MGKCGNHETQKFPLCFHVMSYTLIYFTVLPIGYPYLFLNRFKKAIRKLEYSYLFIYYYLFTYYFNCEID